MNFDLPVNLVPDLECSMGNQSLTMRESLQGIYTKSMHKVNDLLKVHVPYSRKFMWEKILLISITV